MKAVLVLYRVDIEVEKGTSVTGDMLASGGRILKVTVQMRGLGQLIGRVLIFKEMIHGKLWVFQYDV